jgi:hypothetical protein
MVGIFSAALVMMTMVFGTVYQFIKAKLNSVGWRRGVIIIGVATMILIAAVFTYFFNGYEQKKQYQDWLQQSKLNEQQQEKKVEIHEETAATEDNAGQQSDPFDKLKIGGIPELQFHPDQGTRFVSNFSNTQNDEVSRFISSYYENIANGRLDAAYAQSKQSVDISIYKSWYEKTTGITLDKLQRIDQSRSSVELTLYEGDRYIRYGVLMTVTIQNKQPEKVEKSEVRVLSQGLIQTEDHSSSQPTSTSAPDVQDKFFRSQQQLGLSITNQDFQQALKTGAENYLVLDARENLEYENGNFPGSQHI